MTFPTSLGGVTNNFSKFSYDRRNRNSHEIYKRFGGVIESKDVNGILQIDWRKLSLPKFRKNFYKVIF